MTTWTCVQEESITAASSPDKADDALTGVATKLPPDAAGLGEALAQNDVLLPGVGTVGLSRVGTQKDYVMIFVVCPHVRFPLCPGQ